MRACLLLAIGCAAPIVAAPAPLERPVAVEVVLAVPEKHTALALIEQMRSGSFLAAAVYSAKPERSAEWLRRRLLIQVERGGQAVRVTLRDCCEDEGRERMQALREAFFNAVIPNRQQLRRDAARRADDDIKKYNEKSGTKLSAKHQALIRDYFASLATRGQ